MSLAVAHPPAPAAPDPRFAGPEVLFFGVGAQRCGTTWIDRFLRAHPEAHLPARKELHYWDSLRSPLPEHRARRQEAERRRAEAEAGRLARMGPLRRWLEPAESRARREVGALGAAMLDRAAPDHGAYAEALFHGWSGQRVAGEITPGYALLGADTFAEMAALAPDVRFFFVMRDPVERLLSGLRRELRKRHGTAATPALLAERLAEALATEEDVNLAKSRYDRTLAALEAGVGAGRVATFFYETLFSQAEADRLAAHLSLPLRPAPLEARPNAARDAAGAVPEALRAEALARLAPVYDMVAQRFGALPPGWAGRPQEG